MPLLPIHNPHPDGFYVDGTPVAPGTPVAVRRARNLYLRSVLTLDDVRRIYGIGPL